MKQGSKIKVVKKMDNQEKVARSGAGKSARVAAREMVSTVSDWVTEFKSRRSEESRIALEKFFSGQARPSET